MTLPLPGEFVNPRRSVSQPRPWTASADYSPPALPAARAGAALPPKLTWPRTPDTAGANTDLRLVEHHDPAGDAAEARVTESVDHLLSRQTRRPGSSGQTRI